MNKGIAARWMMLFLLLFSPLMMVMTAPFAFAAQGPQTFTLDGRIKQAGTTTPILDPSVKIEVHVMNPSRTCVIYAEEQFVNTQTSNGYFNIQVGSNIGAGKRIAGVDPGLSMATVFQNTTPMTGTNVAGQTCPAGTYTPLARDSRYFRIFVTPSLAPVTDQLDDIVLDAVPTAMVAETADKVGNFGPADLLRVNTVGVQILSQANLENIFTSSNYAVLTSLLAGTSNLYNKPAANGTTVLPTIAAPTSPSAGQIWYNAGNVYFHDGAVTRTISTGSSTSVSAADGSAAAPTISFASDTNTGWYLAAPDNLAAATGGVERVRINENGNLGVGSSAPGARLTLGGNMSAPAWLFGGIGIRQNSATYNDTTSSGATSQNYINAFGIPTLTATSATTYSNASAFSLYPPVPGTNVTLTSSTGLTINSTSLAGGGGTTNGYGLQVNAPTGAANNYAATFMGGNVGIGTTAPQTKLVINANAAAPQAPNSGSHLQVSGSDNSGSSITLDAYGTNFYDSPYFTMRKAQGTAASPGSTLINDILGDVQMQGYFSGFDNGAEIVGVASENWSGTAKGTKVQISAVRRGTTSRVVSTFGDYGLAVGSSNPAASSLEINGSYSVPSWTTTGQNFAVKAATSTDTTGSGAIATRVSSSFAAPTFASSSAVTVGDAATVYIAGAPIQGANTTITRSNSLYVAAGQSYFGGNVGVGVTAPTASLHLKAGTAAAGTAPLKLTAGPVNTTAEAGAIEFDGTSLFYTDSTNTRRTLGVSGAGITALTGDVTASGAGSVVATIPNDTVTFAKMQNIATQRLLGRSTAAAGDVEELTVGTGLTITGGALNLTDTTDDDSFAALVCGNGFVPYKSGGVWTCLEARSDLVNDTLVLRGATGSFEGNQVTANSLRLNNAGAYVSINTPAAANYTLTLPADDGTTSGQVLTTNGSGVLSWSTITPGTGDFLANGTVPMTGQFDAASGTIGAPGISFAADQDTGLSTDGSNGLQFSSGGVLMATLSSVGIIMQNSGVWGSSTPGGAYIRSGAGSAAQPTYSFSADDDNGMFRVTTDTVGFSTAGSERMRIDSTGNVGIGTTAPGALLHVRNTTGQAAPATSGATQSAGLIARYGTSTDTRGLDIGMSNGGVWMQSVASDNHATTRPMFINPNGGAVSFGSTSAGSETYTFNGQIGVTGSNPQIYLRRADNTQQAGMQVLTGGVTTWTAGSRSGNSHFSIYENSGSSVRLMVEAGGNVGVGTTAPGAKLDVKGDFAMSGATSGAVKFAVPAAAGSATYTWPAAAPGSNMVLQSDNTGALSWVAQSAGGGGDFMADGSVPMTDTMVLAAGALGTGGFTFDGDSNTGLVRLASDTISLITNGSESANFGASVNNMLRKTNFTDGTAALPAISFSADTNTGIYRVGADTMGFATGGGTRMTLDDYTLLLATGYGEGLRIDSGGGGYGLVQIASPNSQGGRIRFGNGQSDYSWDTAISRPAAGTILIDNNAGGAANLEVNGFVKVGTTATLCPAAGAGSIRYNAGTMEFCDGTSWAAIGGGGSVAADSLNFTEFSDTLTLDASTSITAPNGQAYALSITNEGTGNSFVVNDQATDTTPFVISNDGMVGIGTTAPTAKLHLPAGTAAAGTAPLKLTAGPVNTAPEAGAIEFDGTSLFYTDSGNVRRTLGVAGAGITALTGEVTASGTGSVAATIANDAVTFAKMQNIATQRLLGRSTAAAGDVEELTVGTGLTITGGALNLTDTTDDDSFATLLGVCGNGFMPLKAGGVWTCVEASSTLSNDTIVRRGATGSFEGNQMTANSLRLNNSGSYVSINTPMAANYSLTLPADDGTTAGQVLTTDGSGVLTWTTPATGSGDFKADGTVPMTGVLRAIPGTAALPGYAFVGDVDTGLSAQTADTLVLSTAGSERVRVDSSGNVGIGTTSPNAGGTSSNANRVYLNIKGSAGSGILQLSSGEADGNNQQGSIEWVDSFTASADKRIGYINMYKNSATANNRGTYMAFATKADNGSGAAERMRLTQDGNVCVGCVSNTTNRIEVKGSTSDSTAGALYLKNSTDAALLYVRNDGNVGIGTTAPDEKLVVVGNVKATSFISTSDQRLKRDITSVPGLAAITKLNGVSWSWKDSGDQDMGVIAQEVEKVFPQSVVTDTGTGYKAVKYNALFAPLIESTKELYGMCLASEKRNDEQDRELASLREENKNLKSEVEDLKKRMERIEGLLLKSAK